MKSRLFIAVGLLSLFAIILYSTGFIGSSSARVVREHSVVLPPSASHIQCGGLFSVTTFGDFTADTSFEIAATDLPGVLSQFTWQFDMTNASIKSLDERMAVPTQFTHPGALRWGASRDTNTAYLQSYDLGGGRVGICIYTFWN